MWKRDQQEKPKPDVRHAPVQPSTPAAPVTAPIAAPPPPIVTAPEPPVTSVTRTPGGSLLIKGEISASEDLVLHGQVHGTVSLPDHMLTIGSHADVSAEITARALIVDGSLNGNVAATERFEIRPGGRMKGDVTCPSVVMSEGAEFTGRVDMRRRFGKADGPPVDGERRRDGPE